jgi:HSP20 family molecular chaperone IbpA
LLEVLLSASDPAEVKLEQIQASMTDGILEVRIPRPAESKPEARKIPVA